MPSVLITSASRGLGLEFVRQYAADGWKVFAACRDPKKADKLRSLSPFSGGEGEGEGALIDIFPMDVTDPASIKSAAAHVGKAPIDVLINSAGVYGPYGPTVGHTDYEEWRHILEVNTLGPMRVIEAFLENVARSARKIIVTITSGMGSIGDNTSGGSIPYRSSKAAVNMVTRSLAVDLKSRGITVVVMDPGWVKTDMGGSSAPTAPATSISGMRKVIEKLTLKDSGKFWRHVGKEMEW